MKTKQSLSLPSNSWTVTFYPENEEEIEILSNLCALNILARCSLDGKLTSASLTHFLSDVHKDTPLNITVQSALPTPEHKIVTQSSQPWRQYAGDAASGQASILLPRAGPSTGSAHACTTSGCPICGFSLPVGATHSCADHPGRPCMDEVVKVAAKGMQNAYDKLKWASGADV